jgi:GLPGLI family protein
MKSLNFLFVISVLQLTTLQAQDNSPKTSGTVTYTEKRSLEIKTEGLPQEILDQLPKEMKNNTELIFNKQASIYQTSEEKEINTKNQDIETSGSTRRISMNINKNKDICYINFNNKISINKSNFMGKDFLINDSVKNYFWKIKPDQKMILGYPCQKAVTEADSSLIEAWFTPLINAPAGPAGYGGLPGLILEVKNPKTRELITATAVKTEEPKATLIAAPVDGKKVSSAQFKKIVEEKTKELQQQFGGSGGNVIIKMSH